MIEIRESCWFKSVKNGNTSTSNMAAMLKVVFKRVRQTAGQIKLKFCIEHQVGSDIFKLLCHNIQYGCHGDRFENGYLIRFFDSIHSLLMGNFSCF